MNKQDALTWVEKLQDLRDDVYNDIISSAIPTDHTEYNFNKAMDEAVAVVMYMYGELVLEEIQDKKMVNDV